MSPDGTARNRAVYFRRRFSQQVVTPPFVSGEIFRFPSTMVWPGMIKSSWNIRDGTSAVAEVFARRCRQIGRHSGESRDPDKFGTEYHTVGADSGFPPSRE